MAFYRRHLPHIHLLEHPTFVTFRLYGSVPADKLLQNAATGPHWLRQPEIASLIVDAILYNASRLRQFELHAFVVMSNHVHLLLTPQIPLVKALHSLKSITAHRANSALKRTGPFWKDESFDHAVRNHAEFRRIVRYIHHNPVRAGLVSAPESYRWSSACPDGPVARPTD